ncbi:MAG: CRTAC1 family protein [Acidobacteriota bacterium]|nr:MAG: CRTAC1 family protein [Acidobacteriota bacterium]
MNHIYIAILALVSIVYPPDTFRAAQEKSQSGSQPVARFREVAVESGLNFHHFVGATGAYYLPEIMGSGGAMLDYDGDGDLDLFLVQGTMLGAEKDPTKSKFPPPKGWKPGNRLFRNELVPSGRLRFTDVTEKAGLGREMYGMGAATGDYDNDGDPDLYVTGFGSNYLYRNNGDGTFTDATAEAGVDDERWSSSAAFVDIDNDGDLDLYVCNYVDFSVKGNKNCFAPTGELDYCSPAAYRPVPDKLFRNDGKGKFSDITQSSGIGSAIGPGLGVTCADLDQDGRIDIYVANDGAANLLWINKGDGKFEESGLMAGAAYGADGVARAGMGVTAGDFDNDGDEDLLVTNLTREGSTLYRNNGKGLFDDATIEYSISQLSFLSTGFGVSWFDYDNDGWLDLFAANGAVTLLPALRGKPYPFHQINQLFRNEGGRGIRDMTSSAGPAFKLSEVSRGAAFGDIDNDGDVDILVTNNNGPARLMINDSAADNHWIGVRLVGMKDNRDGIGARVAVTLVGGRTILRRAHTDGSYLCAGDTRTYFGLGNETKIESVEIIWPGGSREIWNEIRVDSLNVIRQGSGKKVESRK